MFDLYVVTIRELSWAIYAIDFVIFTMTINFCLSFLFAITIYNNHERTELC
jgi:hypothetical protein